MRLRPRRLFFWGALACGLVAFSACEAPTYKPVVIAQGDVCYRCRAPILEKQYAAEFATKDGFVRKFDDIACMIDYAQTKMQKKDIAAYFVVDYVTKEWVPADQAAYVKSDQFQTPQNGGILALKDKTQAQKMASQYQAQLLGFSELLK